MPTWSVLAPTPDTFTVVGVVSNVKNVGIDKPAGTAIYTNTCGSASYRGPWMMEGR